MLLYFTCKKRGIKMEKFWKALETELCARGLKSGYGCYGINTAGNYQIQQAMTPEKGKRAFSVTGRFLEIKPADGLKHVLDIDEIWVGYDGEGCDWSDNMGGLRIDCNGMNAKTAVTTIAQKNGRKIH